MKKIIAVIGNADAKPGSEKYELAYRTGKLLVDNGYRVQSGGMGGIMEAVFKGAKDSSNYFEGATIALLPSFNRSQNNGYSDIVIPTGMDLYRNVLVATADAVIMVGGGAGTLSEVANAWSLKKLIICYTSVEGWSKKLANTRLDDRIRFENIPDDKAYGANNEIEAVNIINEKLDLYLDTLYTGIKKY